LRHTLFEAASAGRIHDLLTTAGQSSGGIEDVLPAAEIVRQVVAEAERALASAALR
jgi:NAD(P)H-dependent flavin oxidoreductase YrpB (nitropropane dioxygenase family)